MKKAVQRPQSAAMWAFRLLGLEKIAWHLRRLHVPVPRRALVLEVGSGGNPYPRADVLVDAYEMTAHRHWAPLVHDRPLVLAFAENLPFRSSVFDFVIASHVLEHTSEPDKVLGELQRVARAGYIEAPDAFMERINPYKDHRLEVLLQDGGLVIRKKPHWIYDKELVDLYEARAKPLIVGLISKRPFVFHVRYYWEGSIRYEIVNPEVDASWDSFETVASGVSSKSAQLCGGGREALACVSDRVQRTDALRQLRLGVLWLASRLWRIGRRVELFSLLRCPRCCADQLEQVQGGAFCPRCGAEFGSTRGMLDFRDLRSGSS